MLSERNELLITNAMRTVGFDSANDVYQYIFEQLYTDEATDIYAFLLWLHGSGLAFGPANSQDRFQKWLDSRPAPITNPLNELRNEIINGGKYLKTSYGISKYFEWRLYSYKGKRYNVSMFNDEVEQVDKIYCTVCGRGTYNIKVVFGIHTCPTCEKAIR